MREPSHLRGNRRCDGQAFVATTMYAVLFSETGPFIDLSGPRQEHDAWVMGLAQFRLVGFLGRDGGSLAEGLANGV